MANLIYKIVLGLTLTFFVYAFVVNLWPSYVVEVV